MPLIESIAGHPFLYDEREVAPVAAPFPSVLSHELEVSQGDPSNTFDRNGRRAPAKAMGAYSAGVAQDSHRKAVLAEQLMTQPVECVLEDAPVSEAWELMQRRRIRHLPVVARGRKLVGIVSDRDLAVRDKEGLETGARISSRMTTRLLTATPETTIREIAGVMLRNRIHAIPIIDSDHRVIGILTTSDILRGIVERFPIDLWA